MSGLVATLRRVGWGALGGLISGLVFGGLVFATLWPVVALIRGVSLSEIVEGLPWAVVFAGEIASITVPAGLLVGLMTTWFTPRFERIVAALIGAVMAILAAPQIWSLEKNRFLPLLAVLVSAGCGRWTAELVRRRVEE